jgi:hypothetical protein
MKTIPTSDISIGDIPQPKANNWRAISIFSLTIPQNELAVEGVNLESLINYDVDFSHISTSEIRGKLYVMQRIINNQEGIPDSKTMTRIIEAIKVLRDRYSKNIS